MSILVFAACNNSQKAEDLAREAIEHDNEIRQRTIDSIATVNMQKNHSIASSSRSNSSSTTSESNNDSSTDSKKKRK